MTFSRGDISAFYMHRRGAGEGREYVRVPIAECLPMLRLPDEAEKRYKKRIKAWGEELTSVADGGSDWVSLRAKGPKRIPGLPAGISAAEPSALPQFVKEISQYAGWFGDLSPPSSTPVGKTPSRGSGAAPSKTATPPTAGKPDTTTPAAAPAALLPPRRRGKAAQPSPEESGDAVGTGEELALVPSSRKRPADEQSAGSPSPSPQYRSLRERVEDKLKEIEMSRSASILIAEATAMAERSKLISGVIDTAEGLSALLPAVGERPSGSGGAQHGGAASGGKRKNPEGEEVGGDVKKGRAA
jgi:hypothetical protein